VNTVNPAAPHNLRRRGFALDRPLELLVLAGLVVVFVATARALRFTVDDAYIAMRYSRNLAEGRGLVYNAGEHVEGFTSPLWVLILAAARLLGFNIVAASHALGITLSVATLLLAYRIASRSLPANAIAGRLIPVVFLATSWIFAGWATGGLETALYAFVTVLGVSALQSRAIGNDDKYGGRDWLPLIGLLIVLTRPDGLLLAAALGAATLVLDFRAGRPLMKTVMRWVLFFGIPMALVELWRLSYYGKWLPNTFYVKVNKVEYIDRGWPFFVSFARDSLFYLWGPVALAALFLGDLTSACIIAYAALYIAYTIWVGGDWMGYRFYSHLLALLSVPISLVVGRELRPWRTSPGRAAVAIAAVAAMLVTIGATSYKTYTEGRETRMTMRELDNYKDMDTPEAWATEVGWGLDTILRPGEAASATFAGFTAMYTDRTIVDALGLTDAYVASLPAIRGGPGHEKVAPREYLASRNVLMVNPWPWSDPANAHGRYRVQFAPGYYVNFDALVPPARVAEILLPRGFNLWVGERQLFDRTTVENVSPGFDFEAETWKGWTLTGSALGTRPADGASWSNAATITGAQGRAFVNTYQGNSDAPQGSARSEPFVIDGDVIHFLIAGGATPGTALELWVDGARVRAASGENSEDLVPIAWDVAEYRGRSGYLLIRDNESGPWGHLVVDDIHVARRHRAKP
jgi:hypothetical protein